MSRPAGVCAAMGDSGSFAIQSAQSAMADACGSPSSSGYIAMSVDHSLSKSMRFCATTWRSSE